MSDDNLPEMNYRVIIREVRYGSVLVRATSPGEASDKGSDMYHEASDKIEWEFPEIETAEAEEDYGD